MAKSEMNEEMKERIGKAKQNKWIESWMAFEVLAVSAEAAEKAMKALMDGLEVARESFIYEKNEMEIAKVDNPTKKIKVGYSKVFEVKLFTKDMFSLLSIVISFGPSSVEILGPKEISTGAGEVQSICNELSGLVHKYASAGLGGVVIAPAKK